MYNSIWYTSAQKMMIGLELFWSVMEEVCRKFQMKVQEQCTCVWKLRRKSLNWVERGEISKSRIYITPLYLFECVWIHEKMWLCMNSGKNVMFEGWKTNFIRIRFQIK